MKDSGLMELDSSSVESGRLEHDYEPLCLFMYRNSCSL
jgi:hypothetical protein